MAQLKYREYKCECCGNVQKIQTNHTMSCIDYCKECSWKVNYMGKDKSYPFNGHTYRKFNCLESE